jgi:hypothetical protein
MSISRRKFCSFVAAAGLSAIDASLEKRAATGAETKSQLRVIAYNVYNCTGWPNDRAAARQAVAQGQMPERFAREMALHKADIINFSESPGEAVVQQIAKRLEMKYVRFPSGGDWPGTLMTRFEIIDSQNVPLAGGKRPADLFTRHWGRATIRLPNGSLRAWRLNGRLGIVSIIAL